MMPKERVLLIMKNAPLSSQHPQRDEVVQLCREVLSLQVRIEDALLVVKSTHHKPDVFNQLEAILTRLI